MGEKSNAGEFEVEAAGQELNPSSWIVVSVLTTISEVNRSTRIVLDQKQLHTNRRIQKKIMMPMANIPDLWAGCFRQEADSKEHLVHHVRKEIPRCKHTGTGR